MKETKFVTVDDLPTEVGMYALMMGVDLREASKRKICKAIRELPGDLTERIVTGIQDHLLIESMLIANRLSDLQETPRFQRIVGRAIEIREQGKAPQWQGFAKESDFIDLIVALEIVHYLSHFNNLDAAVEAAENPDSTIIGFSVSIEGPKCRKLSLKRYASGKISVERAAILVKTAKVMAKNLGAKASKKATKAPKVKVIKPDEATSRRRSARQR